MWVYGFFSSFIICYTPVTVPNIVHMKFDRLYTHLRKYYHYISSTENQFLVSITTVKDRNV